MTFLRKVSGLFPAGIRRFGSKIMKTDAQMGIILNIVVGIIGGLLGGFLLSTFLDVEGGGIIFSFITCLLGACILLFLVKLVTGRSRV
ncbi:GlsB/YeaQ/YmgE family stress response membrane protein [Rhodococcus sp. IEGM 1401]|uniref:GlsB/YeaQ/YmgE family stress response membrane protein n=1 Tax=unclassified Rhodococcus (in: high G+C Gram-positive bacteria) TaxID=192944 RepID=UPI0022B5B89D|nr:MULTISPECIES: GlsB/YeaQ/YmgE family stress response membrane protein [unclassified Rhodococcus (in: high G+C Gram-positive bacteria)]MCZ4561578.1 GlsB/YeaQ/YmgE family stress response membrane protein [Rhodococcus sp. IEGM 1401]MDI9921802.1 GlsB/YeaQ/YmgE family stress response membrane protein [Rhodococcus sp. IEGM 1372]MDI9928143.1 GlsB/YeaQ/YmgE family stress response membrane protein [Rhodococcus sp. IEGM 1341]MDV8034173.1 GlsB/YeaQ/YmgE family stress response membrane protein [Rhodococc